MNAKRLVATAAMLALLHATGIVRAQDENILLPAAELEHMFQSEPLEIKDAELSRPKAKGDITLKANVSFGGREPMRIKVRKAEPGAETFNNVPRYDLAAYELQKLFLDPLEYVVPPTALRMLPLAQLQPYSSGVDIDPTFRGSDDVLCVLQYWLQSVMVVPDVLDPAKFATDAAYARHVGQMNVLTYLIRHGDSNLGNFIISQAATGARVFSVDNGVSFSSEESDRGKAWRQMRVDRLPADLVERLRKLTEEELQAKLGVLAQWELRDGHYVPVTPGENIARNDGVRRKGAVLQMGLTRPEIGDVWRRLTALIKHIDKGDIDVV